MHDVYQSRQMIKSALTESSRALKYKGSNGIDKPVDSYKWEWQDNILVSLLLVIGDEFAPEPTLQEYGGTMAATTNIQAQFDHRNPSQPFLGAWTLVFYEHRLSSGEIVKPLGDNPSGQLIYEAGGHMSAQLSAATPKNFARKDVLHASDPDASPDAFPETSKVRRRYIAYWGTFQIDPDRSQVIHHVEGSFFPNWIGTEQHRHFQFEDNNRLILQAKSPAGQTTLIWQKKSS